MNGSNHRDEIKLIPYGISEYKHIRLENYYYVDKTRYLKVVKDAGRYLFFIRPRRFGKSLFLSMMETYYDVLYKDSFDQYFKGTWIYDNPTGDRGSYLVLILDFSMINPGIDQFEVSFLKYIREMALSFIRRYSGYLQSGAPDRAVKFIDEATSASDILSSLVVLCKDAHQELYVIIDEYDNFTNTILSTKGKNAYEELTRGAGSFRAFFNVLKGGTRGPFSRLFLSGVSPVTPDDVTSGYNIGHNAAMDLYFNRMLGFTAEDVLEMIEYFRSNGMIPHETGYLMEIMTQWYGNYRFSEDDDVKMFNADMVLYFLNEYTRRKQIPKHLIDGNVKVDYGKLKHLIVIDKGKAGKTSNGNFNLLKNILEKGKTTTHIVQGFPFEQLTDSKNFKSLLFYLGLLTIDGIERDKLRLTVPNETIKRLYYNYIEEVYDETGVFSLDLEKYSGLMSEAAYEGYRR